MSARRVAPSAPRRPAEGASTDSSCPEPPSLRASVYDAFRRDDSYGDMGMAATPLSERVRLCVMLVLLAPVRLFSAILLLLCFYGNVKLAAWIPPYGRTALPTRVGRTLTRLCLAVLGFVRIERVKVPAGAPAEDKEELDNYPVLIVSNHVSWLDIVVHFYLHFPATFIMKQAVFGIPIIGSIGKHIRCIGVVREDKSSSDKGVSQIITDRLKEEYSKAPAERRAVLVFAEGTTTNGRYLLPFKSGAFIAGAPAKPVILKYHTGRVSPSYESIDIKVHLKLMLANLLHHVTIYELPTYFPSAEEAADAKLYAQNLREYMAKHVKLLSSSATLADKREYHRLLIESYNKK